MSKKKSPTRWLPTDKVKVFDALLFNVAFLVVIWALWLLDQAEPGIRINQWGTRPRSVEGLIGIVTTPFLHGSFDHIKGNSLSFFTLSSFLIFFYREIAFRVLGWLYIGSGIVLWMIAQGGNHIGASGVIYGLASFIFISGVIRKNPMLLRVSLVVAFLYGSIIWWVLPIEPGISWEGHLAGALVGATLAVVFRNRGPKRRQYRWEIEEELEESVNAPEGSAVSEPLADSQGKNEPPHGWQSDTSDGRSFRFGGDQ